jgi:formyl-CoA transferase
MIAGNSEGAFTRLMTALGRTDLAADTALSSGPGRAAHEDELNDVISAWTSSLTAAEADRILAAAGVPAGPILGAAAIADDPQYRARDMLRPVEVVVDGDAQEISFPGIVPPDTGCAR